MKDKQGEEKKNGKKRGRGGGITHHAEVKSWRSNNDMVRKEELQYQREVWVTRQRWDEDKHTEEHRGEGIDEDCKTAVLEERGGKASHR